MAFYIQDKMEFDAMVINFGLRYDKFDPNTKLPSDRRNPANQLSLPDTMMSSYPNAKPQVQISPRFGLAYQLGNAAVLHSVTVISSKCPQCILCIKIIRS